MWFATAGRRLVEALARRVKYMEDNPVVMWVEGDLVKL